MGNNPNNRKPHKHQPARTWKVPGANVEVRHDDVNGALRRLRKILENNNRQKELAKHEYYEKPSAVKKRERAQAIKRAQKERIKQDPTLGQSQRNRKR